MDSKSRELVYTISYTCFGGKNNIFKLIQDSDAEKTKDK